MSGDLIPVTYQAVGGNSVQTVNARQLHQFLEVGKVFAAWIMERIEQYGFSEHLDFEVFSETGNNPQGGRPAKEYALSLSMAKELAMVERNAKGKEARAYFIRCEERARQAPSAPLNLRDPRQMVAVATQLMEINGELTTALAQSNAKVERLTPKAEAFDAFVDGDGVYTLQNSGRILGSNGHKMGPNQFIDWLKDRGFLFYQDGVLVPYGKFVVQKLFKLKVRDAKGKDRVQTYVTARGIAHFHALLSPQGDLLAALLPPPELTASTQPKGAA